MSSVSHQALMANTSQNQLQYKAVLKQIYGEKINEEYELTGSELLIGRHPKCKIKISSPSISRRHCALTFTGNAWRIRDNESQNGTYINGRRLSANEDVILQPGDIVFLGPPSEMPQAFSYEEIMEQDSESIIVDEDILELPVKRSCEENTEMSSKRAASDVSNYFDSDVPKTQSGHGSGFITSETQNKNGLLITNEEQKRTWENIPEDLCIAPATQKSPSSSKVLKSRSKDGDTMNQIYEISSTDNDNFENSESLLHSDFQSTHDANQEVFTTEVCTTEDTAKDKKDPEVESQLALLAEEVKALKASKLELLKNYQELCEKNKELDLQLADKQRNLENDFKMREVKAKNELKSELLEKFEEDLVCNICTELFIKPTVLDCSHTFCEYCIKEWRKKKNDCPICRCKIKNVTRVRTLEEFIDKTLTTLTPEQRVKRESVIAERVLAEKPPPMPVISDLARPRTPARQRRGRRYRHHRTSSNNAVNSGIQIVHESSGANSTHTRVFHFPSSDHINLPLLDLSSVLSVIIH